MDFRRSASVLFSALVLLATSIPSSNAAAPVATIIGELSNFDTFNNSGEDAHGFEIELEGVIPADVQYWFGAPYNRYGTPALIGYNDGAGHTGTIVRWAANFVSGAYDQTTVKGPANPTPTDGHSCYLSGPAGATQAEYDASGCEHFGVGTMSNALTTTYHWLVDDGNMTGTLVRADVKTGKVVQIPPPVWTTNPTNNNVVSSMPLVKPQPLAAFPDLPACALWGPAQWVKIYKYESDHPARLGNLLTDDDNVPDAGGVGQVESEWKFLQAAPTCQENGQPLTSQPENELMNEGAAGAGKESVTRRYEFFAYSGAYDDTDGGNHEARPINDSNPAPADLGGYLGAQMAAANLALDGVAGPKLFVTISGNGRGRVTSPINQGISCGDLCGARFDLDTVVTLTAAPSAGSRIAGWIKKGPTEDFDIPMCGTNTTCAVTLSETTTLAVKFTNLTAPEVSALTPTSGAPGTHVAITGANFGGSAPTVTFNGTAATVASATATTLDVVVPCGAGTGDVVVQTGSGSVTAGSFTELTSKPVITTVSPRRGLAGTSVTVDGSYLYCVSAATLQGTSAVTSIVSDSRLLLTVPVGASTGVIALTNSSGTTESTVDFVVAAPVPTLTGFSPSSGGVGTSVTLTGTGFAAGMTVSIGGTNAKVTVLSSTKAIVGVPKRSKTGKVGIKVGADTVASATNFAVGTRAAVPTVKKLSPTSAKVGKTITITGTNLAGTMSVTVGGKSVPYRITGTTTLVVTIAAGAKSGVVVVTTDGGKSAAGPKFTLAK